VGGEKMRYASPEIRDYLLKVGRKRAERDLESRLSLLYRDLIVGNVDIEVAGTFDCPKPSIFKSIA
jgi:hypothetical protein